MIFLERKECLLTSHSDRRLRLWSTKRSEFLHRVALVASAPPEIVYEADGTVRETSSQAYVHAQSAAITALYADSEDRWLFTGDADGWVRIWDLEALRPGRAPFHLLQLKEMQPHRTAVTQLQHFVLDNRTVVMSASADWTIALHTFEGARIGSFSHNGPHWRLSEPATWSHQPPGPLDDNFRGEEEDDGWGNPKRSGKGQGGRRDAEKQGAGGGMGGRTPRGSKVRTKSVIAPAVATFGAHSGQGDFKKLSVVERFKPDLTIAQQENSRLSKWHAETKK
mmetsp:Transcript_55219/g.99428  ORF Transcript_55219/g.99428 Transcript_55219/m.99428 type:complete len:280 (-) Transcript_55219:110-949(-)